MLNSTAPSGLETYYFYKTEQLIFLWIIFLMIVFGNVSVLITLYMSKNRKTRMVLVTYSSTYVLVSLSIDRYDAITNPLNFSGQWRRAKLLVTSAWLLSGLLSVPALFLNKEMMIDGHPQCWISLDAWQWQVYITLVALSLFFFPAIIISGCYSIIVHTIWTKSRLMEFAGKDKSHHHHQHNKKKGANNSQQPAASSSNDGELTSTVATQNSSSVAGGASSTYQSDHEGNRASSRGVIPRAKIKTVKMTFVIVFVFILCWSPYFVWDLLQVYGFIPLSQTTIAVSTFIQSLAPLNSAANPIIYCLFSTHIYRNLRKLSIMRCLSRACCLCCPNLQLRPIRGSALKRMDYATMNSTTTRTSSRTNTQRFSLTSSRSSGKSNQPTIKKTVLFRNSLDEVPEQSAVLAIAAAKDIDIDADGNQQTEVTRETVNHQQEQQPSLNHNNKEACRKIRRQRTDDSSNSISIEATIGNSVL